jgi:hypothetical protein
MNRRIQWKSVIGTWKYKEEKYTTKFASAAPFVLVFLSTKAVVVEVI